jgi:hypothetical protein
MAGLPELLLELVGEAGVHRVERQRLHARIGPGLGDGGGRTHRVPEDADPRCALLALDPVDHCPQIVLLQHALRRGRAGGAAAVAQVEGDEVEGVVQARAVRQDVAPVRREAVDEDHGRRLGSGDGAPLLCPARAQGRT